MEHPFTKEYPSDGRTIFLGIPADGFVFLHGREEGVIKRNNRISWNAMTPKRGNLTGTCSSIYVIFLHSVNKKCPSKWIKWIIQENNCLKMVSKIVTDIHDWYARDFYLAEYTEFSWTTFPISFLKNIIRWKQMKAGCGVFGQNQKRGIFFYAMKHGKATGIYHIASGSN